MDAWLLDWGAAVQLQTGEAELLRTLFGILCSIDLLRTPAAADAKSATAGAELASCMRELGFRTRQDSDVGLVSLARCVFASPVVEVDPDDPTPQLGDVDDPPDDIPPRMAQLIRVIATLEGTARRAGCPVRVVEEWRPFLATQNAFTENDHSGCVGLKEKRAASRRRLSARRSGYGSEVLGSGASEHGHLLDIDVAFDAPHAPQGSEADDHHSDFPVF